MQSVILRQNLKQIALVGLLELIRALCLVTPILKRDKRRTSVRVAPVATCRQRSSKVYIRLDYFSSIPRCTLVVKVD